MEVEERDLSHAEDEDMEEPNLPLAIPLYKETPSETGFHRTTRLCLEKIREAMLHNRWQEAAEYISYYTQSLDNRTKLKFSTVPEMIWRISIEVLHHLPGSKLEHYVTIYDRLKHLGVKLYLTVSLEHAFHLLLHDQLKLAKRQLTVAESWRYGKISAAQRQKSLLIQAYRSLLDYIIWCDKKSALAGSNDDDDVGEEQNLHNSFRQASVNLDGILRQPGVWDPFVLSYVGMLQFYDDHEGAANVLENYAYDSSFPPNPNAKVYLYQFLLTQKSTNRKKRIKVLKDLHSLVPSHELMLDYSRLLQDSEEADDLSQALGVILDMLDFACWSKNLEVWTRLRVIIDELRQSKGWKKVVADKMAARADWWPMLHFTRIHASQDATESPGLKEVKAGLLPILFRGQKFKYSSGLTDDCT